MVLNVTNEMTGSRPRSALRVLATRLGRAFVASFLLLILGGAATVAAADIGHKDFADSGGSAVSGSKPESKLWFNDGFWWASMQPSTGGGFFIYKLDPNTDSWVSTGTPLDNRNGSRADTLWDDGSKKLYVATQVYSADGGTTGTGSSFEARLYRFSYNSSTYTLDNLSGTSSKYAVIRSGLKSETLVIAKDSLGTLWATWTQKGTPTSTNLVKVSHTVGTNDGVWSAPVTLPVGGSIGMTTANDDISTIIAFKVGVQNRIGVLWSNQADDKDYFAWRADTDDPDSAIWTGETALSGTLQADDHVNIKTDSSGQLYAVVKTSLTGANPLIKLLRRTTGGSWNDFVVGIANVGSNTRPILELEENGSGNVLHVFMTGVRTSGGNGQSGGDIFEKTSPTSSISFPSGLGTTVIRDDASAKMNNVTSTKQNVNSSTGIVMLAFNDTTDFYWHGKESLAAPTDPQPAFTQDTTSGPNPLTVQFTDQSTGTGISNHDWTFGDGGTSTATSPSHQYNAPGTYTVSLKVTGTNGNNTLTKTNLITVNAPSSTVTLTPDADAQVKSDTATTNYGTLVSVRTRTDPGTGSTYRTYLRFKITGVTGTVTGVKLRLFASDATSDVQSVFATNTDPNLPSWIESGTGSITWNNAPTITSTLLGSASMPILGGYNEIALSPSAINGTYVTLAITSAGSNSLIANSKEAPVPVNPPQLVITQFIPTGPTADFVATTSTSGGTPLSVSFDASASTGTGLTYAWLFGDSGTDNVVNPTHNYTVSGTYTVTLTVTDSGSATAQKVRTNYIVVDSSAVASFTKDKIGGNTPLTVAFDGTGSSGSNLVYTWDFGDPGSGSANNTSNLSSPSHIYNTVGTFNVTLTVSNAGGPNTSAPQSITTTGGSPVPYTVAPVADAHVNSGSATTNYGSLASIRTREDATLATPTYRPYFQFTTPAFSGTASSIKLRLFVTQITSAQTQNVYLVGNGWTESGITWTNAPVLPGSTIGSGTAGAAMAYVEFTLTTPILPSTTYSFALKGATTTSVYFNTKEAASNPPQLVFVAQ